MLYIAVNVMINLVYGDAKNILINAVLNVLD